jgi:hypothetical protein
MSHIVPDDSILYLFDEKLLSLSFFVGYAVITL